MTFAQEQINAPKILELKFEQEFKGATDVSWSLFYRGKFRDQLRYEVEFLKGNTKYLVSYDKEGNIRAIEKSIAINSLNKPILDYLKREYPTFDINEASIIKKDDGEEFYNIGVSDSKEFFVLVFTKAGDFLYLTSLGEKY
ncbi:MAG: hypothetical protein CMP76_16030 [Flavobacterium sp.]|nr:hypothetical protein [Flavobacterium sp.]|tara:strand:+ start:1311 stop:1733 length:423 start_codon:yes stop_codon:yes gene_type:complete